MAEALFYILAASTLACGMGVVTARMPLFSVLSLLGSLFCLSAIYLLSGFQFIAATQVLVYAGAIMVLFMFIVMLLNLRDNVLTEKRRKGNLLLNAVAILLAVGGFVKLFMNLTSSGLDRPATVPEDFGTTAMVAESLFTRYLLPFEIASVLLLVSIIGAVVLAKNKAVT